VSVTGPTVGSWPYAAPGIGSQGSGSGAPEPASADPSVGIEPELDPVASAELASDALALDASSLSSVALPVPTDAEPLTVVNGTPRPAASPHPIATTIPTPILHRTTWG
jgi:hypothetical protein